MPSGAAELWSGVNQRSVVMRSPPPFGRSFQIWTVFLPNVGSPTIVARPVSFRAPATISDAEADPSVDEHDHRNRVGLREAAGLRLPALDVLAGLDREEQLARRHELAGDALGGGDEAAGVAAQVEHDRGGALVEQRPELLPEEPGGAIGEGRQPDVADAVLEHPGVDLLEVDDGPGDRDVELLIVTLDGERDIGAGLPAYGEDQRADRFADG